MALDRFEGIERLAKYRHEPDARTWDIFHVHPNNNVIGGVQYRSTLHCYLAQARPEPVEIRVWVPGGVSGERVTLGWGSEWWAESAGWGIASVVLDTKMTEKVPLHFFWELLATKA